MNIRWVVEAVRTLFLFHVLVDSSIYSRVLRKDLCARRKASIKLDIDVLYPLTYTSRDTEASRGCRRGSNVSKLLLPFLALC